jgi:hypothetical protein
MVGFAHPTLKRGAGKHCAYGAVDGLPRVKMKITINELRSLTG